MKTLIFNGSPRKNGDTSKLLEKFCASLDGEVRIVRAYDCGISPCVDCRYCWKHPGCAIKDEMTELYDYIGECDNIVIASPVYFSTLTGPLLSVLSRVQTLFCSRFFRGEPRMGGKRGAVIVVGGGDGSPDGAVKTARMLLRQMGADEILPAISFHDTNHRPAAEDEETCRKVTEAAAFMSGR
ncbi:MAG: flavodoxin family protein [Oscillospiraceae bacterium]|nr:flavodoxin family protein [Oscillospiraceae bacterium]